MEDYIRQETPSRLFSQNGDQVSIMPTLKPFIPALQFEKQTNSKRDEKIQSNRRRQLIKASDDDSHTQQRSPRKTHRRHKSVKPKSKQDWDARFFVDSNFNYDTIHQYYKQYFDKPTRQTPLTIFSHADANVNSQTPSNRNHNRDTSEIHSAYVQEGKLLTRKQSKRKLTGGYITTTSTPLSSRMKQINLKSLPQRKKQTSLCKEGVSHLCNELQEV